MKLKLRIVNADHVSAVQDRAATWNEKGGSIGRMAGNDWVLADPDNEISRIHAHIHYQKNRYYIEDLSTNGVFIGDADQRIGSAPYQLHQDDMMYIGPYQIHIALIQTHIHLPQSTMDDDPLSKSPLAKHIRAQRVAFNHAIEKILAQFDSDYVDCAILQAGETRKTLKKRLYDTVFNKAYHAELKKRHLTEPSAEPYWLVAIIYVFSLIKNQLERRHYH